MYIFVIFICLDVVHSFEDFSTCVFSDLLFNLCIFIMYTCGVYVILYVFIMYMSGVYYLYMFIQDEIVYLWNMFIYMLYICANYLCYIVVSIICMYVGCYLGVYQCLCLLGEFGYLCDMYVRLHD